MNRNIKRVFLITTLLFLLVGLSALSAADVTDSNATTTDSSVQSTIVQDTVSDAVATTSDTNIVEKNTIQSGTTKETKTIKNDEDSTTNDYEGSSSDIVESDIEQIETTITLDESYVTTVNNQTIITGKLVDDSENAIANAVINVTIGETSYTATTNDSGIFTVNYTPTTNGTFDISAVYDGNNKYTSAEETSWIDVEPIQLIISLETISTDNLKINDKVTINGTLTDEYGNTIGNKSVIISINGEEVATVITDSEGKYNATITVNTAGDNLLTLDVVEADGYTEAYNDTTFNVNKIGTTLTVNERLWTVIVGNDAVIKGTLSAANGTLIEGATITVTIDGNKYNVTTDENGAYSYNYTTSEIKDDVVVIVEYAGSSVYDESFNDTLFNIEQLGSVITIDEIEPVVINETVVISGKLTEEFTDKAIAGAEVTVTIGDNTYTVTTDNNGTFTTNFTAPETTGIYTINVVYAGNTTYESTNAIAELDVEKASSIIVVDSVKGVIGEKITLTAHITDSYGNNITGGNIVFKLNGKTLRVDGLFNSTAAPLKFSVVNGLVTYTLNADLYLRNAKNLSASYSGNSIYEANTSEITTAQIAKRSASITVTTDNLVKHDTDVKFKATLTDVTKNGQNTTAINENGYVIFKVNGVSLKDANGKIIRVKVENNSAVYTYHVPVGMASVDGNGNLRNYTVEAVYQNDIFYPDTRNTTVFHVEKSSVKVNINSVTLNNKTKSMAIKANLTDANGNLLVGTNKICVKVNGKTLRDSKNETMYFTVTNGIINLPNINTTGINKFKNITIVTGERQAYTSGQSTTTKITVV
ncbi:carboxypeptidase-like regulatory domain-containing protein [Methanosphaera sp. WGK6]|uniref:carboxypeptidase-like regulatory domain-containing protein n=1 Tax=Methanosphaera sp. WGK6 TaxID=1561964 RepID=UPI00084C846D|nr:carboxypeptidase-like regulatory domain-containing protein [Methanosphaera sp. WGK6]OED29998.1 hypothetical protein NL43_05480 [Methanosphaera sp. WGK6]